MGEKNKKMQDDSDLTSNCLSSYHIIPAVSKRETTKLEIYQWPMIPRVVLLFEGDSTSQ